ncbi:MAG: YdeI/OmpD-associated family protein [Rhodobacteraceae bacterium]|nr:YdeI/OmpD-associated family protein [Paracoccaceae bacterium]
MAQPETLEITSANALWDWLRQNHATSQGVRLITWKTAHPAKYVSREEVLDALLAHGWIDGRRFVVDQDRTAQLITPRKQQAWSDSYKTRVARLRAEGRMHPAGEAAVQHAAAAGLWDFFADVDRLDVPADLAAVLDMAAWDALPPSYRRNVLRWIKLAKAAPTRAKRISATAQATAKGQRLPQM